MRTMEELYQHKFGSIRIVSVRGYNKHDVILEDLKTGLMYAILWDTFFKHYVKLEKADIDVSDYEFVNLDKARKH